jgi:Flp pilus assembly protein TadD
MNNFFKIRHKEIIICLFLIVTTLAVYWQMTNHEFLNYDDDIYITKNHHVQAGLEGIAWAFTATDAANWHPLTWVSHMLDAQLYGMNPGQHHMTNLLFHIVNTLLLFLIFKRMTGHLWRSGFIAALFTLHPLHVESVAWVAERKDVLCAFFWMLTMYSYVRYVERPEANRYFLVLLFFMMGLMAKPMIVTLPFALLLLDYWPLRRFRFGRSDSSKSGQERLFALHLILEKAPLFLLTAASSVVTLLVQQSGEAMAALDVLPLNVRIGNALVSYAGYLGKMFWPHEMAVLYPHPGELPLWQIVGACLLLISISLLAISTAKQRPWFIVGWLWYIGTLVPVIGLVQVGTQAMADRYTYVPLIGIFIVIAWFVPELVARRPHKKILLATLAIICLSILMTATWIQVRYWENSTALFKHTLNVTANNHIAHTKLGEALAEQNRTVEAIRHYSEALRIEPGFVQAHLNMGDAHASLGNSEDAVYYYNKALQKKPNYEKAHNNLGNVMARQGNFEAAVYHYNEALKINPNYAGAYYNLGKIAANQGKIEEAIFYFKKTLEVSPNMAEALYNLSWIAATAKDDKFRNGIEAIKLAEKLCKLQNYSQPLSLDALAAAYAEARRFKEAVLTAQKGLELALEIGPKELSLGLENRLKLYKARRPYRQTQPEKDNN